MAGQANDTEKLPWLEPYREPAAPTRGKAKSPTLKPVEPAKYSKTKPAEPVAPARRRAVPLAAWLTTGVVVVGLAAGGGYWAGHRTTPASVTPAPTVTIPVAKVDPIPMPDVAVTETAAPAPSARSPRPVRKAAVSPAARSNRLAKAPPSRPQAAPPMPKVMAVRYRQTTRAANPGMVIDLGRYLSPSLAWSSYRAVVGRYPYLSRLTKVVVPQPAVYGQPRLYALQLGARSPSEARQLCDNLKKIGRPCLVR